MEIAMAALADTANVSVEGKLNVTGIFDSIYAHTVPATHPQLAFAFRVKFEVEDQNKLHRIEVTLIDADSHILWGAGADLRVGPVAPGQFAHVSQVILLNNVVFPKHGRYRFRIKIGGKDEAYDSVFQIIPQPPQPPQPARKK